MARVRTSESARRAGRPGRRGVQEWLARHQSSTDTYNETRKESRSMRHHLWEKVRYQHKISAPSPWSAITHQTSKKFTSRVQGARSVVPLLGRWRSPPSTKAPPPEPRLFLPAP